MSIADIGKVLLMYHSLDTLVLQESVLYYVHEPSRT